MSTLQLALVFFSIAGLGGMGMLALRFRGGNPPLAIAPVHGLAAAAGLVTLTLAVVGGARGPALLALVLFVIAAMGGLFMLSLHLKAKLLPIGFILAHGAVAAGGILALIVAVLE